MDLIYTDSTGADVGVLIGYALDLAFGSEENDFALEMSIDNTEIENGAYIYIEGTEYGGVIDGLKVDTEKQLATYVGRSFHGILNSKVIQPPSGLAYLTLTGDANTVIASIITDLGLGNLFEVETEASGITILGYQMDRYIMGYDGINKMLKANGAKLAMSFVNGKVKLAAKEIVDYSQDEQYTSDHYAFKIQKHNNKVNHLICLGSGELTERQVVHLYVQADGSISTSTQDFIGLEEYAAVFDYPNAESLEELEKGGREHLQKLNNSDTAEMQLYDDETVLDINDKVGTTEEKTKTKITNSVVKKIVKIQDDALVIKYKVGD
ncbi:TPA: hypothetical protein KZI03_000602 [Listeria monocytogenes]|nr:hypothetical protein [Listeria monocytogenes]HBI2193242.1 hypothetical protein [Listeria monocytogenes]